MFITQTNAAYKHCVYSYKHSDAHVSRAMELQILQEQLLHTGGLFEDV